MKRLTEDSFPTSTAGLTTTRLRGVYVDRLAILRASILDLTDDSVRDVLLDRVQDLADELVRGTAPLEELTLDQALARDGYRKGAAA